MMGQVKGVNLGGWLVLEKWMAPQLFAGTDAEDEYYLPQALSKDVYEARMMMHRANFITEADFLRIASLGINTVRLPVPYFIFGDRQPFLGGIDTLDNAFNWAEKYGLQILLDLHTAPGSQNGFDNGGLTGVVTWAQQPEEVDFELSVLTRLAERYGQRQGLYGIEALNEPATQRAFDMVSNRYQAKEPAMAANNQAISFEFLYEFYTRVYAALRPILADDKIIMFHDGFDLTKWADFFTAHEFKNVVMDTHHYLMLAELAIGGSSYENYEQAMAVIGDNIAKLDAVVPVVVGEWSLFNSMALGQDSQGGVNPTQAEFKDEKGDDRASEADLRQIYNRLWELQIKTWGNASVGYFYWSYKMNIDTVNDSAWYGWDSWSLDRAMNKQWATTL
ncbi:cellulase family glycosylhydrolase [Weissella diestrammenae]|nr:cellulase family glycosylhydrolase [Weissella diestrammenae]